MANLTTPQIARPRTYVTLGGVRYLLPTTQQIRQANALTDRQLELFREFMALPEQGGTDQSQGRRMQIMRMIAALDRSKHRLTQTDVIHLLPDELRKLISQPWG